MSVTRTPSTEKMLPGSDRSALPAARSLGAVDPATVVELSLVLRRRAEPPAAAFAGEPLSRAELAERYGADPADLDLVVREVQASGAEVVSADPASRLVRVRGSAETLTALFGTSLQRVALDSTAATVRMRTGALTVTEPLTDVLTAVLGLDDRPQAQARSRVAPAEAAVASFTPVEVAQAYDFPPGTGTGQTIAIVELGGGFAQSDLDAYFGSLGLPTPNVRAVSVDGGQNVAGGDPNGADGEVLLDIEVAGSVAPDAAQLVYFAPNTDAGFLDAVVQAAHASPAPTVMSISWGQSEDQWTGQARTAMDNAFADAALLGVTVTAAAGDSGSADNQPTGAPHADFPASSPHVLGCGGTTLRVDANGSVTSEVVWDGGATGGATGGGVSDAFPLPDWQATAGVPARARSGGGTGRGVPDVAGDADPRTGYQVRVDGQSLVIGGTSAVAPLWAGLVCRVAEALGRPLGLLQLAIYAGAAAGVAASGFRDITTGNNGAYKAEPGWDACTGLGVPDGAALLARLRSTG